MTDAAENETGAPFVADFSWCSNLRHSRCKALRPTISRMTRRSPPPAPSPTRRCKLLSRSGAGHQRRDTLSLAAMPPPPVTAYGPRFRLRTAGRAARDGPTRSLQPGPRGGTPPRAGELRTKESERCAGGPDRNDPRLRACDDRAVRSCWPDTGRGRAQLLLESADGVGDGTSCRSCGRLRR